MRFRQLFYLTTAVLAGLILLAACADVDPEEIKFRVIGYGGTFSGSYSVDSGELKSFHGSSIGNDVYSYEKALEVEDQLEITASPDMDATGDAEASSLEIKIYRDNSIVKQIEDKTSPVEQISITYTSGETAEEE